MLAKYGTDFYKGRPALTVNAFGKGRAYYIASRNDDRFHDDFYGGLTRELGLKRVLGAKLPKGVTAQLRTDGKDDFVFLLNFQPAPRKVNLARESIYRHAHGQDRQGNGHVACVWLARSAPPARRLTFGGRCVELAGAMIEELKTKVSDLRERHQALRRYL